MKEVERRSRECDARADTMRYRQRLQKAANSHTKTRTFGSRIFVKDGKPIMLNGHLRSVLRLLGYVCVVLATAVWAATIMTDPKPGLIAAAGALTLIVAMMIALISWQSRS